MHAKVQKTRRNGSTKATTVEQANFKEKQVSNKNGADVFNLFVANYVL